MAIQPEKPEVVSKNDDVDASINTRLTHHLLDNAVREPQSVPEQVGATGIGERVIVAGGMALLMSILGLFSLLDIRKRLL